VEGPLAIYVSRGTRLVRPIDSGFLIVCLVRFGAIGFSLFSSHGF
jgi:hypothetical protein